MLKRQKGRDYIVYGKVRHYMEKRENIWKNKELHGEVRDYMGQCETKWIKGRISLD